MKISKLLIFALSALCIMQSCSGNEEEPESNVFEVTPLVLDVEALGGQKTITVLSGEDWIARAGDSWVKLMTSSGKGSAAESRISVSVSENSGTEQRQSTVLVKTVGGKTSEVIVRQEAGTGVPAVRGISSAEDLLGFAKAVNEGGAISLYLVNGVVKLLNDIDASSITEWIPAGTADSPLAYTFDGDGHTISNISWTVDLAKYPEGGFIGCARNVTVRNLKLGSEGSRMSFNGSSSQASVGAVTGRAEGVTIEKVTSNVDVLVTGNQAGGSGLSIGGICGFADQASLLGGEEKKSGCVNNGNVFCSVPSSCGGIAGHSEGKVMNCTNNGTVLGKKSADGTLGPAWGCSYNKTYENFTSNFGYGHVGDYDQYKDNPESAPAAMFMNAVVSPENNFDLLQNTVDWTLDEYYDWTEISSSALSGGVKYTHYSCDNVPRHVFVLEVDLTDPSVEVTTAYADDCIPNPNGNGNSNNGKNIRETLSELCARKRAEGHNIIAGINTGFFDSNDGISRGFHIEEGRPVYINNPAVVSNLGNHKWGFTVFTDGTASCGVKEFSGKLSAGGKEYNFCSVNDTILRHVSTAYAVNLYTSQYRQYPHPEKKTLVNNLAPDALYVVAEYSSGPMKVNCGYADAVVKAVYDGRSDRLTDLPYLTGSDEVGISLSGTPASEISGSVKAGDVIRLRCDIKIDGDASRPIYTQNSTMYQLMSEGRDYSNSPGSSSSLYSQHDPITFPVVSQDGKKVWFVAVDGRQGWYSTGIKGYELYRIAAKLGGWSATRFDGGGSTCMWVYDSSAGSGKIVNSVSDSKGERSCLNYILIKTK